MTLIIILAVILAVLCVGAALSHSARISHALSVMLPEATDPLPISRAMDDLRTSEERYAALAEQQRQRGQQ